MLHLAALQDRAEDVRQLLAQGRANVDQREAGDTALVVACSVGSAACVAALLGARADVSLATASATDISARMGCRSG